MLGSLFYQFFLLGCTSFGGPAAHLGYFQRHFVENKQWLTQQQYGQIITLSQMLPGPGSSQVGFAIGLEKAGILGGIAAFIGFTLPSALIMLAVALGAQQLGWGYEGLLIGLKLFAVVIVLDAIISMSKNFCSTWALRAVALLSALVLIVFPFMLTQLVVLVIAAISGWLFFQPATKNTTAESTPLGWQGFNRWALALFALLFIVSFFATSWFNLNLAAPFYQAGALVFGGGHVVLPLLDAVFPNLDQDLFLSGYAAAQAIPGPMFSFATYLGAVVNPDTPLLGALFATLAIFLPGFLLVIAFYRHWQGMSSHPVVAGISAAINAAVIGFLLAALYHPIWPVGVQHYWQIAVVAAALWVLRHYKPPILMMLGFFAALGLLQVQF